MTCTVFHRKRNALRAALAAGVLALAGPAVGQEQDDEVTDEVDLDRIQVTGSRISRTQIEGPSPVTVLQAEDIQKEGFTTVYEALNSMTQNVSNTQDDQFAGGFTQNANVIDLRGLGPGRTLMPVESTLFFITTLITPATASEP